MKKLDYQFATREEVLESMGIDVSSYHEHVMKSCHDSDHDTLCHESIHSLTCHDSEEKQAKKSEAKLSKSDWWYLVNQLEQWRVFNPRAIITKYGPFNAWEAMVRTKENHPRIPGAYFTKVVRSLAA